MLIKNASLSVSTGSTKTPTKRRKQRIRTFEKKLSGKQILPAAKLKSRGHSINRTRLISETKRSLKVPRKSSGKTKWVGNARHPLQLFSPGGINYRWRVDRRNPDHVLIFCLPITLLFYIVKTQLRIYIFIILFSQSEKHTKYSRVLSLEPDIITCLLDRDSP